MWQAMLEIMADLFGVVIYISKMVLGSHSLGPHCKWSANRCGPNMCSYMGVGSNGIGH